MRALLLALLLLLGWASAASRDFYKILGVSRDVSDDKLKRAYRKLAMKVRVCGGGGGVAAWGGGARPAVSGSLAMKVRARRRRR